MAKRSLKPANGRPAVGEKRSAARTAEVEIAPGATVPLDGDLVNLIDALYREFAVKRGFAEAYADLKRAIERACDQMGSGAIREYFSASLFLNYTIYENEMASRLAAEIAGKARRAASRARPR